MTRHASLGIVFACALAVPASAEIDDWLAPIVQGRVTLDMRARYEFADISGGPDASHAATLRTRLGYGTKPWRGLSATIEGENVATVDDHAYFDGVPPGNGRSVVADPSGTEVNQAYLLFEREDFGRSLARVGRQRLVLDDARFIGNVGWRQNEQTYDAAFASTGLGVEGLEIEYGYLLEVHRIFGNQGNAATRDWDSDSHLVRVAYEALPWLRPVAFAYLLDLEDSPLNSADTFGVRLTGELALAEGWSLDYQGSWAYQVDAGSGAGDNPTDYAAYYALADLALGWSRAGTLGAGYELLGSDDGTAQFGTPLATAHKFNGWADAFLDNGGPRGLQDLFVYAAPKLPWKLSGRIVFHQFWSHDEGLALGHELDAVLSRPLGRYLTVLAKAAWFEATSNRAPADRVRVWLQLTLAF